MNPSPPVTEHRRPASSTVHRAGAQVPPGSCYRGAAACALVPRPAASVTPPMPERADPEGANPAVSSVSAFFPCFNDEATMEMLSSASARTLERLGVNSDIAVVDDGSSNDSRAVLKQLMESEPRLTVVTHEHNRGYGGTLISGFASATGQWVFYRTVTRSSTW